MSDSKGIPDSKGEDKAKQKTEIKSFITVDPEIDFPMHKCKGKNRVPIPTYAIEARTIASIAAIYADRDARPIQLTADGCDGANNACSTDGIRSIFASVKSSGLTAQEVGAKLQNRVPVSGIPTLMRTFKELCTIRKVNGIQKMFLKDPRKG
jgi:hypothetical protein